MICPKKFNSGTLTMYGSLHGYGYCGCEKDNCAWWDKSNDRCMVVSIGEGISVLSIVIEHLANEKMKEAI